MSKDEDNHVLDNPHVFLDEIMRQAQESEIIRFSMFLREGKRISQYPAENKEVMVVSQRDVNSGMYLWADQILCATNNKRNEINKDFRILKGFNEEPEIGDKIIGLHNQWDFLSDDFDMLPLTNGTIGTITFWDKIPIKLPKYICSEKVDYLFTTMSTEDGHIFNNIPIDYKCLKTGEKTLTIKQEGQLKNYKGTDFAEKPYEFAYAYAITTHKSQGSQWDKVLVFEENFPFEANEHARWVYTAATRAAQKLVIVKK